MEALCAKITILERFKLDAFDLEVSEDVGGGNIAAHEEIALKDVWENEQIEQFSLDKFQFERFSCSLHLSSADNKLVEEDFHQSHQMDICVEVAGTSGPTNLLAGHDMGLMLSRDEQINEENRREGESDEDEAQNISIERVQSCGVSQEDFSVSFHGEVGPVVPFEPSNESHHQVVEEQIEARANQMRQEAEEVHEARYSEASVEWIRDRPSSYQEENTLHNNKTSVYKETPEEPIEESNGDNHTE